MSLEFLSENFHSYDQQWKIPFFILWKIAFPPCRLICKIFMEKWFSDFPRIALLKLFEMLTFELFIWISLTRPVWKIQQLTTPTKWGISRPPCVLGGYYPPTTDHMVWGSADPPMGGYGVILLYYRGRIAKSSPILSKDPGNFMKLLKWILGAKH